MRHLALFNWLHMRQGERKRMGDAWERGALESCGGILHGNSGTLMSPNYPQNYPHNLECEWTINVDPGYHVSLNFDPNFFVEAHSNCIYDYVLIRDGDDENDPVLGASNSYCANNVPEPVQSTSNVMFVKFCSDFSSSGMGFSANWIVAMPSPEDLRVTTITGTTVKASWTAATSPIAIGYRVWIMEWESPDDLFTHYLSISKTEVTFKDLVPATEYIISATTIYTYIEGPEVQVTAVTETEPPSVLDVEDRTIDSVVISWLPPKGVIVQYSISYTGGGKSTSVTCPGDAHSCELTGLIPGTRYDIALVAVSRVGRSVAVTTSVITDTDPPSAVEVNSWSATWMVLEWKAPLARVVSYEVTVSQTFGEELFSVDGSETSYNITELLPETHYIIKMAAVGEHGRSVEITCSKQTGPLPLPVDHPTTSTRATTEAHTSVTWRDTTVTSTSFQSTTKRTTATSTETTVQRTTDNGVRTTDNGVRTTDNGVRTTDRQTTTVYSTSKEERPLDKTTYSTFPAKTTESPDEKLQHILQGIDEEQLESAKLEDILSAMNCINDVLTISGSAKSSMSLSAMKDASALIDKLAGASRGAQSASVTDMANIANALTQSATAVIDKLPEQQPPIVTTASSNILESDLIDVNSADLSPKQQLKMLKEKQKEKEDMQKRAALNIVKSLDSVADTLLALQPGNAEYQTTFGTENVGVTLSRSPSNRDLHLSNGPITATIPSTGSGSQTNSMLDLKMLSFKKNPYSWKQSTGGQNISSPVTVLSMETRGSGKGPKQGRQRGPRSLKEEKQVNLDIPFVPLQERELTTDAPHVTTHKPGERSAESSIDRGNGTTMTYHRFSIPVGNVIPVLHMSWWDVDATFHVYFSYGSKPTFEKYDEKRVIQAKDGYEAWLAEKDVTVTFTPNTTRRGGALYVGVQKIDRGSSSPKKPNRERTANYSLLMSAVGCSSWDEDNERWGLEQCNAKLDIENNIFHCECRTVGSSIAVGTMTLPTPNSIDFLTAFKNFSNLRDNAVVLSIVVSEYILYIINMVLLCANFSRLWGKRSQDQRKKTLPKVSLIPPDRMPAPHLYQLTVTTGSMFGAGTTSRVAFQLFGSEGTTPIKMLNPGGEALVRGSTLHFIMPVRESLGEVTLLRIWHDNSGEGDTSAWFLGNFLVRDVKKDAVTHFRCHDWLSEDKGDGEVQKVVHATPKQELRSFGNIFTEATSDLFYDKQLWTSALVAPPGSSFTQAQRLSCCFTLLNTMMLASAMWYRTDDITADTKVYNLGVAHFTVEELYTSLMTALTVAPVNLMIVQLFRMEAPLAANTPEMSIVTQAPKKIRPPTKADCQGARKKRELSKKTASTLKELFLLFVFVNVLFYIAQANNDQNVFYETRTLSTTVLRDHDNVRTPDQFYMWTEEVLLPTLYPTAWYNGRKMKFLDRQFAQDTESFRFGPPRLTQARRRPGATTWKNGAGLGWSLSVQNMSHSCWQFKVPDLPNHPNYTFNCTNHHSLELPLNRDAAVSFFRALKDSEFLDKYTVSMAIDINFYNPSLKLFSVVHIVLDHSGIGNLAPTATITSFGLFQYESDADFMNLFVHVVFMLLFSAMVYKEAKLVKNMGWKYFASAWNALGFLSLVGTATVISVFIKRYTVAADTLAMIAQTNGELGFERFVDLTTAAWWGECFAHAVGVVVFINTFALLRVVRFSQTIGKLLALPGIMKDELLSFLVVAAIAFMSFISAGYLIFRSHLKSYSNLYHTTLALFEMMLGRFFAGDMLEANPLIGPVFFSTFMVCIFILLMNCLMSIVCDAISADVDVNHDHELAEHIWSSVCAKLGLHSPPSKEVQEPGELKLEKLQENLRIIHGQLDESLDLCDSLLPSRRRGNLDEPSTSSAPRCEVKIVIQHAEDD
ncbi:PREDICTED: LOW QUALITY PROTEIN: uncharacterized protein LOC109475159 [Branchiostoma belcheri]|uniref:LOW QUALITY PROTEIN: uncharacterized protein LOC109475159 n=1 Tax=Branchiostoma belcheri TaxID=7741 RepID=A0A6P4ZNP0_BRABE|nr:PREDICTED: LOW QUALITY PROTEIN: uncharacterized protein LOC109475159 [Branchiostoma belcheri]